MCPPFTADPADALLFCILKGKCKFKECNTNSPIGNEYLDIDIRSTISEKHHTLQSLEMDPHGHSLGAFCLSFILLSPEAALVLSRLFT